MSMEHLANKKIEEEKDAYKLELIIEEIKRIEELEIELESRKEFLEKIKSAEIVSFKGGYRYIIK